MIAHRVGERDSGPKGQLPTTGQEGCSEADLRGKRGSVDHVLARQAQRGTAEVAVQLGEGHQATRQGHAANKVTEEGGNVVHAAAWHGVCLVGGYGRHHGRQADQGVEGSHSLRQSDGLHLHAQGSAHCGAAAQEAGRRHVGVRRHAHQRGRKAAGHAGHAQLAAHLSRAHAGEAADGADAQELRDNTGAIHGCHAGNGCCHQRQGGDGVECRVVLIARPLEEVKHALRHDETTRDVNSRGGRGKGGKAVRHAR
mmetsp:Transcript_67119/g.178752  ORF Transcript_67119/g.178752 Transcript_67119/m.178752 type:complete len:254 (-) Transcript_67119:1600-2361(-)